VLAGGAVVLFAAVRHTGLRLAATRIGACS
jgi:hypothetical protein